MSRRLRSCAALAMVLGTTAAWPATACAQSAVASPATAAPRARFGPFGPRWLDLDSITVGVASRALWRGVDHGSAPLLFAVDLALWRLDGVQDRHTLTGSADGSFPLAARDARLRRVDRVDLGGGYRYRIDTEDGEARVALVARRLVNFFEDVWTSEINGAVQRRIDAPWTELRPLVGVFVARGLDDRFEQTYVEPSAAIDAGIPRDDGAWSVGGRLAVTASLGDAQRRDASDRFGYRATSAGLWLYGDRASTPVGPLVLELGVEHWWSAIDARSRHWTGAVRLVKR